MCFRVSVCLRVAERCESVPTVHRRLHLLRWDESKTGHWNRYSDREGFRDRGVTPTSPTRVPGPPVLRLRPTPDPDRTGGEDKAGGPKEGDGETPPWY